MKRYLRGNWVLVAFALIAMVGAPAALHSVHGWADGSRMAAVEAVVERGTLNIDATHFETEDRVFIDGHFYSDKLVMPVLIGAVAYWPLYQAGLDLEPGSSNLAYTLIVLLVIKTTWFAGLIAIYISLGRLNITDAQRLLVTISIGFSSLYLTWSATFNNHLLAAGWAALGFAFYLGALRQRARTYLLLSGTFLGLAGSADMPIAILYIGFLLLVVLNPALRRHALWYLVPLVYTVGVTLGLNYAISGSIIPVQLVPSHFRWPGSPWSEELLSGVRVRGLSETVTYGFLSLLGPRGFLFYNPLLFLALICLVRAAWKRHALMAEARVILGSFVVVAGYYVLTSANFGGGSYSIRWWVPFLPLAYFFLGDWIATMRGWPRALFWVLFLFGVIIAVVGVVEPWSYSSDPNSVPFVDNLLLIADRLHHHWPF